MYPNKFFLKLFVLAVLGFALASCGGGSGSGSNGIANNPPSDSGSSGDSSDNPDPPPADDNDDSDATLTGAEAARFLSQSTFGPNTESIDDVVSKGLDQWFIDELDKSASLHLDSVYSQFPSGLTVLELFDDEIIADLVNLPSDSFWQTAIEGNDQLRQRMAYALSQILVISSNSDLRLVPNSVAHYMDILTTNAFGNYRDLMEDVTYSPAMSVFLTYLRNEKADPETGRVPDENYAREILQLFTVGLVELNQDGSPALSGGEQQELYTNDDITGLAKVFTGLSFNDEGFITPFRNISVERFHQPLQMFEDFHSEEEKAFLDTVIPAGTQGEISISLALDAIFEHPNLGPFIGRQLIQRFVTSHPQPEYVARVTESFNTGRYTLPEGQEVGTGQRGDLAATIAAVLFDDEARTESAAENDDFGKVREPVLRFTHWARAFEVNSADASNEGLLKDTSGSESLGQHPYRSPSVFNFYRPGYIAPNTVTGDADLNAPELQITNATSVVGYPNFITVYALGANPRIGGGENTAFQADYSVASDLADNNDALLDYLDLLLTHGEMTQESRERISDTLDFLGTATEDQRLLRAQMASVMVMSTPEYIVLR